MRDGWEALPFGDVLELDIRRAGLVEGKAYPIVGVLAYGRGLLYRQPVSTRSTSYRELNVIRPNQLVYSKLKAFEGAITVAPTDLVESYASGEFPTFTMKDRVLPTFVRVMTQRKELWEAMAGHSKGIGGRRERLNPSDFLSLVAKFPPLPEQRRIVDLIGALDDALAAVELAAADLERSRPLLLTSMFAGHEHIEADRILLRIEGGRSPKALDRRPRDGEAGVLKVSAVKPFGFVPEESKTVGSPSVFSEGHRVRAQDVLISRANTSQLVGAVCLVLDDFPNLYLCDKTLRLIPVQGVERAALVAGLNSPDARAQLSGAGTGSSASMKNISQKDILSLRLRWPTDRESQGLIGQSDQALLAQVRAYRAQSDRLRSVRLSLLAALLSGEHEIPGSYDELMGEAS